MIPCRPGYTNPDKALHRDSILNFWQSTMVHSVTQLYSFYSDIMKEASTIANVDNA